MASISGYQAVFVSVIAEVAKNYIIYKTAQERLIYANRNVAIQQRVVDMTRIQFKLGNVSELDMQQAKTQLYNTKATIEAIRLSQKQAINALALLLATDTKSIKKIIKDSHINKYLNSNSIIAKYKGTIQIKADAKALDIDIIPKPKLNPYYKIDANLLTQRPDIKAAEHIVHSEFAKLGVEMTKMYPSFSLFGNIGYNSDDKTGSWIPKELALGVSVGPSISWDILNYDRIENQIRLQDATLQASIIEYNKKVLTAITEVKSALDSYRLTLKQLVQNKKALQATIRAFNLSIIQYNDGLVSYQRLLTTIEKLTLTQDRYASLKGNVALSAIALYKALGGGWQITQGKSYISTDTASQMKSRTNWDKYLDNNMTKIPRIER
jgi:outer membrane protein TolC